MKALALLVVVVAATGALAGEAFLGTLMPRGASTNNKGTTGDAGFLAPKGTKLTAQCRNSDGGSADSFICINVATCTAQIGVEITGNQALPTSSAPNVVVLSDGGTTALVSAFSNQSDNCEFWQRAGNEF